MVKGYKHLKWEQRLTIERLLRLKYKPPEIAKIIGCSRATIYNEINRASYIHHSGNFWKEEKRYSPELSDERYKKSLKEKGKRLKILKDERLIEYIENKIVNEKYSPAAVLMDISSNPDLEFDVEIKSVHTIYNYIKRGDIFENLTMEKCPYRKKRNKKTKVRPKRLPKNTGKSIEVRPDIVDDRIEFGHWEMDTVKGKQTNRKCLLVLTERKTRFEYIELMKAGTALETVRALNRIEKRMGSKFFKVFKTITVDNGVEFSNYEGMEKALYRVGKRTEVYYCHPYSSSERGSNENQNKLIRRHYPKGSDFDKVLDKKKIKQVENWINEYPRLIFEGRSSKQLFDEECEKLEPG